MKMMGNDLVSYVVNLRSRMNQVAEHEEIWELGDGDQQMKVAFVPRTDPPIEDASGALAWRIKELKLEEEVVATVSTAANPAMLFDYYGFPEHTYHLSYPAPGDPDLARPIPDLEKIRATNEWKQTII